MTPVRIQTSRRLSKAVVHGGVVYLAGLVASTGAPSIADETRLILKEADALLAECGSNRTRLISALLWLRRMSDYDEMNEVWDAWVPAGYAPARACVEAALARSQCNVEIMLVAAVE